MTVAVWIVNGALVIGVALWWWVRRGSRAEELWVPMTRQRVADLNDRDVH